MNGAPHDLGLQAGGRGDLSRCGALGWAAIDFRLSDRRQGGTGAVASFFLQFYKYAPDP
jgi:hypothetical protein